MIMKFVPHKGRWEEWFMGIPLYFHTVPEALDAVRKVVTNPERYIQTPAGERHANKSRTGQS